MIAIASVAGARPGAGREAQLAIGRHCTRTNGSEQIIPGVAVMFAFLTTQLVSMLFFREHSWGTWDRLRASSAGTADHRARQGRASLRHPIDAVSVLLFAGRWLFGFRPNGFDHCLWSSS